MGSKKIARVMLIREKTDGELGVKLLTLPYNL